MVCVVTPALRSRARWYPTTTTGRRRETLACVAGCYTAAVTEPPKRAVWFRYTDAASVGIEMVVAITVCALGALWLERNVTHWAPWTSIIGIGLGLGAATKAVVRTAKSYRRQLAESPPDPEPEPEPGQSPRRDGDRPVDDELA